jgi:hypothetical protein
VAPRKIEIGVTPLPRFQAGKGSPGHIDMEDDTAAVQIFGRVYPAGLTVDLHAPQIKYASDDGALTAEIDVKVIKSDVCVSWTTTNYNRSSLPAIWVHSRKLATALVDLIAFRMGAAATVIMDRYQDHTGHSDVLAFIEPKVKGITTLLDSDAGFAFRLRRDSQRTTPNDSLGRPHFWPMEPRSQNNQLYEKRRGDPSNYRGISPRT